MSRVWIDSSSSTSRMVEDSASERSLKLLTHGRRAQLTDAPRHAGRVASSPLTLAPRWKRLVPVGGGGGRAAAPSTDLSTRASSASARSSWRRSSLALLFSLSATGALAPPRTRARVRRDGGRFGRERALDGVSLPSARHRRKPRAPPAGTRRRSRRLGLEAEEDVWSAGPRRSRRGRASQHRDRDTRSARTRRSFSSPIETTRVQNPSTETTPPARPRSSSSRADSLPRGRCPRRFRTGRSFSSRPMQAHTAEPARSASRARRRSRRQALAAIVLDDVGADGRPRIALAGDGSSSPARTLVRTASARVSEQTGQAPALPSVLTQLVDLGIPLRRRRARAVRRRGDRRDLAHDPRSGERA